MKRKNNQITEPAAQFPNTDLGESLKIKMDTVDTLLTRTLNLNDTISKIDELKIEYNTFASEHHLNPTNPSSSAQTNLILFSWIFGILFVLILLILLIIIFSKHTRKYTRKR
ncbi:hypothetical protein [Candidatus Phytoplasma meliae]|uniref:Uncharacterized protein n=1 Tax=Candidatus Phytoplasma meliae TaxID=1848402 RepID=A0ABS5CYQ1_9MOLU|nr:hypothetical protein [Candidatus Phytoplasma meliae]MBP5836104.1 hypothetical protein [Candidatus Phytoplasma meliae]